MQMRKQNKKLRAAVQNQKPIHERYGEVLRAKQEKIQKMKDKRMEEEYAKDPEEFEPTLNP